MTDAIIGLIGVLIGALIGNRLSWDRDDRISRAAFASRMCEHRASARKITDENFPEWFAKAQIDIEKECGLVHVAIRWPYHRRFAAARKQCSKPQTIDDIADPNTSALGSVRVLFTYERGRTDLIGALDKMIACAS